MTPSKLILSGFYFYLFLNNVLIKCFLSLSLLVSFILLLFPIYRKEVDTNKVMKQNFKSLPSNFLSKKFKKIELPKKLSLKRVSVLTIV